MEKIKIGIIGCGVISGIYLKNLTTIFNDQVDVVACADLFPEKAKEVALQFGIPIACSPEELLADPSVELVLNLTIPAAHAQVNLAILRAGKHLYCEKPLALTVAEGDEILTLARQRNLVVGCAPDTFLGAGFQAARLALDEGRIGTPLSFTANLVCHGHESWHPAPAFYYRKGAGPMMDMGPYYITALVALFGPITRIHCVAKTSFPTRTITSQSADHGKSVNVEVPTHYAGLVVFRNGVIGNINMSFDVWRSRLPCLEIHGTEGSMLLPDPNMFSGPTEVILGADILARVEGKPVGEAVAAFYDPAVMNLFESVPMPSPYEGNMRGLGVADMASALRSHRRHRADGELALHVLEALTGFDLAASGDGKYEMKTDCSRPAALPCGLRIGEMD